MSYIRSKTDKLGHTYWYEVESRRVGGEPRQFVKKYLGTKKPE